MDVNKIEDEVSSVEVPRAAAWIKVQIRRQVNVHLNILPIAKSL